MSTPESKLGLPARRKPAQLTALLQRRNIGAILSLLLLAFAIVGSFWTPHAPNLLDFRNRLLAPGPGHWLGTDEFGRDVLSRLMKGASASLIVSVITVIITLILGIAFGVVAGFFRGNVERLIMAVTDALLAFPGILLALGLLAVFGPSEFGIVVALGIAYTPSLARLMRATVISLREREFVEAARLMGYSNAAIIRRHIMPHCGAPLIIYATSMIGWVILAESALSFLGLGVPPPAPTWGNMLAGARPFLSQAPWLAISPGLCISLALLGVNLFGDSLRDRFDPRMRGVSK